MKLLKYPAGFVALILFFLIIDQTGIGFRNHMEAVKKWADGESNRLHFERGWKNK